MTILTDGRMTAHIVVLTADDCHLCQQGKETLGKLGREFPLEVEEVALESERGRGLAEQYGVLFPPGLFLEGSFVGFGRVSERKVRKLLLRRLAAAEVGA